MEALFKLYFLIWLLYYFPITRPDNSLDLAIQSESNLSSSLLSNGYNKNVRPTRLTRICVLLRLKKLISIDEKTQIMTSSIYLRISWLDPRLEWKLKNNESLDYMLMPAKSLWLPDLAVINSADGDGFLRISEQNLAEVHHTGSVFLLIYVGELKTRCQLDLYYFPFDTQNCSILINTWMYHTSQLRLNPNSSFCDQSFVKEEFRLIENHELWKFISFTYSGFDYGIQFNLIFKRMPLNSVLNNIFPCLVLNAVTFIAYFLNSAQQSTISRIYLIIIETVYKI